MTELKEKGLVLIASKIVSITYQSYTGGDSVRVKAFGLSDEETSTLKNILNQYQEGSFDSMQDLYTYSAAARVRGAKHVFLSNEKGHLV